MRGVNCSDKVGILGIIMLGMYRHLAVAFEDVIFSSFKFNCRLLLFYFKKYLSGVSTTIFPI